MVHSNDQKVKKDDRMPGWVELLTKPGQVKMNTIDGNRVRNMEIFPKCAAMGLGKQKPTSSQGLKTM